METKPMSRAQRLVLTAIGVATIATVVLSRMEAGRGSEKPPSIAASNEHLPAYYLQQLSLPGVEKERRVLLIEALAGVAPEKAAPFLQEGKQIRAAMKSEQIVRDKADLKAAKEMAAREAKRRKLEGVSIGMSRADALASSWGRPTKITTLTRENLELSEWRYPGGRLYFHRDTLIQIVN